MATTLSNPAAVKAVGDYLRLSGAYETPLDSGVIERLGYTGVNLGPGTPGGNPSTSGSTGDLRNILKTHPVTGLLNLILKYGNGNKAQSLASVTQARDLLIVGTAYERPLDQETSELLLAYAHSTGFDAVVPAKDFLSNLRDAPFSTLIYLLFWVGSASAPASPYA